MCSWNKFNVLGEDDSSDGTELEYESMVDHFEVYNLTYFNWKNWISVRISVNNYKETSTVYIKKTQVVWTGALVKAAL